MAASPGAWVLRAVAAFRRAHGGARAFRAVACREVAFQARHVASSLGLHGREVEAFLVHQACLGHRVVVACQERRAAASLEGRRVGDREVEASQARPAFLVHRGGVEARGGVEGRPGAYCLAACLEEDHYSCHLGSLVEAEMG